MVKRILCFIKKDMVNALRDNIVIYVLLFPIILALVFRIFLPNLQQAKLTFAVDQTVERSFRERLGDYGNVQFHDTRASLISRIENPDDVPGIVMEGGKYQVILEGNESQDLGRITGLIIDKVAQGGSLADFKRIGMNRDNSSLRSTMASVLVLAAILVAGILMGLNIIDEKENKTIRGIAVSPMGMFEYIGSRTITVLFLSTVLALLSSLIMIGWNLDYGRMIMGVAVSVLLALIIGLLTGGLADNQMSGMAVIKILMLIMIWVPLGALFVPSSYQFIFYIFPHYWVFQIFLNVFGGTSSTIGYFDSCVAALITSSIFISCMTPMLKKRLKLR